MLSRLVLAVNNRSLQKHIEKSASSHADVLLDCCGSENDVWQRVVQSCGDVIVVSESLIPSPVESGIAILNNLPEHPTTVILSDHDSAEKHAQLVASGADVVLYTGASRKSLAEAIDTTLESRRQLNKLERLDSRGRVQPRINDFISDSEVMRIFMNQVRLVAPSNSVLLILGETGVGKEHLAKAIHSESPRAAEPFVTVNTAALPEQLLESELFGHTQGAFTGAIRSRRGAFEMAHGGTIFLDEIGEMPLHLQTKLLRVLQDYEVRPVGEETPIWVDVRVIAATNRDLEKEVEEGNFRKDLYYRLNVVTLTIPPIRERKEDIPAFVRYFINYYHDKIGRDVKGISGDAMNTLCRYDWPGNVRELMNVIERAMLLCKTDEITLEDLPAVLNKGDRPIQMRQEDYDDFTAWKGKTLAEVQKDVIDRVERKYLKMVLKEQRGKIGEAARIAGIHPRGLYNKMKRLSLRKEDFKK